MPYITREDGERFVIPSYRDVLSAKKDALLKREITLLSSTHGEYIALQRKNISQYEIAFSNEAGYLLGETVWHYFKRPQDLIYCEAIPNTSEAILIIVKSGSVYLDGSFPIESISEELLVFRTQQSHFEIYIYGDVPISEKPEGDKFALDSSSVKSFTILEKPAFPQLPLVKAFQLQLVEAVLRAQGIGVFPVKKALAAVVILLFLWIAWGYFSAEETVIQPIKLIGRSNPQQAYMNALTTPDPATEIRWVTGVTSSLFTIEGWYPSAITYMNGLLNASMKSTGTRTDILFAWAARNKVQVIAQSDGFHLIMQRQFLNRVPPTTIYDINKIIGQITDKISYIVPGNNLRLGKYLDSGTYKEVALGIDFSQTTVTTLDLIGQQLKYLPLTLTSIKLTYDKITLSGSFELKAYGI